MSVRPIGLVAAVVLIAAVALTGCAVPRPIEGGVVAEQRVQAAVAAAVPGAIVDVAVRRDGLARELDVSIYPLGVAAGPAGELPVAELRSALTAVADALPEDLASLRFSVRDALHRSRSSRTQLLEIGVAPVDIASDGSLLTVDPAGFAARFGS